MVEFEKPPKPAHAKVIEGILILVLLAIVIGAILSIMISVMDKPRRPVPVQPPQKRQ